MFQFDSKKSPLALLAATCNNIGKDCSPPMNNNNPNANNGPPSSIFGAGGRTLSCGSPPLGELKLPSPLSHHGGNRMRLASETSEQQPPSNVLDSHTLGGLRVAPTVQPNGSVASGMPKPQHPSQQQPILSNPPGAGAASLLKYMDKLSPVAAAADYSQQLQAKFASALAASAAQNLPSNLLDSYDPLKLAAAIQQAKAAAASAYMFPPAGAAGAGAAGTNPLSALASLTGANPVTALQSSANSAAATAAALSAGLGSPGSAPGAPPASNANSGNGCQMCGPPSQFIAGGGHSPSKPGVGSPYITFVPVKTPGGSTALVPVCADRGCVNCIAAIRHAQLSTAHAGGPNSNGAAGCTHCLTNDPQANKLNTNNNNNSNMSTNNVSVSNANPVQPSNQAGGLLNSTGMSAAAAALLSNPLLLSNPSMGGLQSALHTSPSLAALYQQLASGTPMDTSSNNVSSAAPTGVTSGLTSLESSLAGRGAAFSPKLGQQVNNSGNQQELPHRCKWAPVGGGSPCGKGFSTADELMDHIKQAHMNPSGTNNSNQAVQNQQGNVANGHNASAVATSSPQSAVSSAIEEANVLQQLVNSNRRLSPSVVAAAVASQTVPSTLTSTNSFLGSLGSLSAAAAGANPLASAASLTSSLGRKMPGSLDLASALSAAAAARYHPYSKFGLPPSLSANSTPGGVPPAPLPSSLPLGGPLGSLGQTAGATNPSLPAGLTPAGLNALLSSATAASTFLMYDLPKA